MNLLIASREYLSPLSQQFRTDGHMGLEVWGGEEMLESTGRGEEKKDIPGGILLKNKKMMRM